MSGNTFGNKFCLTTFGESHGVAIGGIIDGCPAGLEIDFDFIQSELNRRRPGQSDITTQRSEPDRAEFLSGIFDRKTTGTPIGFIIKNTSHKSEDYDNIKDVFRPSTADFTYFKKYGIRDYRGGGRQSARETAARVVAGAVAKLLLKNMGINIIGFASQIGNIKMKGELNIEDGEFSGLRGLIEKNSVRCPDEKAAKQMTDYIKKLKDEGDSIGGIVTCIISGLSSGFGEPVFDKLHAELGKAMLSINAAKGFDYGSGFELMDKKGSELNDFLVNMNGEIRTQTNFSGGIQGGISNGEDIYFRVAFKPPASISKKQKTVDLNGNETEIEIKGRHDPCVVPRAVPVVEAMAAITIADFLLRS